MNIWADFSTLREQTQLWSNNKEEIPLNNFCANEPHNRKTLDGSYSDIIRHSQIFTQSWLDIHLSIHEHQLLKDLLEMFFKK